MSEDRYEKVLLNMIVHYSKKIIKAQRKIDRLRVRDYSHPEWSETNLGVIETTGDMIRTMKTKIDTIWSCLNHYRSLLGIIKDATKCVSCDNDAIMSSNYCGDCLYELKGI